MQIKHAFLIVNNIKNTVIKKNEPVDILEISEVFCYNYFCALLIFINKKNWS